MEKTYYKLKIFSKILKTSAKNKQKAQKTIKIVKTEQEKKQKILKEHFNVFVVNLMGRIFNIVRMVLFSFI